MRTFRSVVLFWVLSTGLAAAATINPSWRGLGFLNGLWVGAGDSGIFTSPDALTWTQRVAAAGQINNLRMANGVAFALGPNGLLLTSTDALTWTSVTLPTRQLHDTVTGALNDVAYGQGLYVISGAGEVFISPDAVHWTDHRATAFDFTFDYFSIVYGDGTFVIPGPPNYLIVSTNGVDWQTVPVPGSFRYVQYGNGIWVAVAFDGVTASSATTYISNDAVHWRAARRALPAFSAYAQEYHRPAFIDGYFLIPCMEGVLASADGDQFVIVARDTSALRANYTAIAAGADAIVATGLSNGFATSEAALVLPPGWQTGVTLSLVKEPLAQVAPYGSAVQLSVEAAGPNPRTYQWTKDGLPVAGATDRTLTLGSMTPSDAGSYAVSVDDGMHTLTSHAAALSGSGPTSWLINVSVRANVATAQTLIVGLTAADGSAPILIRGIGPGLASVFPQYFTAESVMRDPRLSLFPGAASSPAAQNDDWPTTLAAQATGVGAFPLPAGSKDAGFLQTVSGANNTVWLQGTGAGGIALVEAYSVNPSNAPRLINISARMPVGAGADALIAGFNVAGTGSKRLLVRAIGPALQAFGVAHPLADPRLELHAQSGALLAANDNWDPSLATVFDQVGAFGLTANSRDAALLITVPAGAGYTAQVNGADASAGEALVEVYEVP